MVDYHTVTGEEQGAYIINVKKYLTTLAGRLSTLNQGYSLGVREVGRENSWDLVKLPSPLTTYRCLADRISEAIEFYEWFNWQIEREDFSKSKGFFDSVHINNQSGLPDYLNFLTLLDLRSDTTRGDVRTLDDIVLDVEKMLYDGPFDPKKAADQIKELHREAMKRNFLEQLTATKVNAINDENFKDITVQKLYSVGPDTLWQISSLSYSPLTNQFEIYILDLWQDYKENIITQIEKRPVLNEKFAASLQFNPRNATWYLLDQLDTSFAGIKPVHLSVFSLGPFENRYLTNPDYATFSPVLPEEIKQNDQNNIFHCTRRFSLTPNTDPKNDKKQLISQQEFQEKYIVIPAFYAAKVLTTPNQTIFEM